MMRAAKKEFRKNFVFSISASALAHESAKISAAVTSHDWFKKANSISIFCSRKDMELDTTLLINAALDSGKSVFIPRCNPKTMEMVQLHSMDDLYGLPLNKWGIPEPRPDEDRNTTTNVDLVIMPGLAFDVKGNRIGFGKGYYDGFLKRCPETTKTIAIGHSGQLVDAVPVECGWDVKPNLVLIFDGTESEPLDLVRLSLDESVKVKMKNDRILNGKLHAFDQHMNLVLGNVSEQIFMADPITLKVSSSIRKHDLLFVRGDGVILLAPVT